MNLVANLANRTAGTAGRGSAPLRQGFGWFAGIRAALQRSSDEASRARARRELWSLAESYSQTQPELAKDLRAAACRDPST